MERNEIRGAARLAADVVGRLAEHTEQTHHAVATRVFDALGPLGAPVRPVHDTATAAGYAAVRGVAGAAGAAVCAVAVRSARGREVRRLDGTVLGSAVLAAANGLLGDRLAAEGNDWDLGMTLRHGCRDLPPHPVALAAAYPDPSAHLVLLVPGLMETEHAWRYRRSRDAPAEPDYGQRLAADLGVSPLYLRYNSGHPLAANGASLSALLDTVVAEWPVPVRRIDLIGHSMGGLVLRHACGHAVEAGPAWRALVGHVVYLGVPHAGASLAKGAGVLAGLLSSRPASRGWGELVELSGSGIHDLRVGVAPGAVPPLPGAAHHTVTAELTTSARHLAGRLLGDLLVHSASAWVGVGDRLRIAPAHHFDLLNHPEVYQALRDWLGGGRVTSRREPSQGRSGH